MRAGEVTGIVLHKAVRCWTNQSTLWVNLRKTDMFVSRAGSAPIARQAAPQPNQTGRRNCPVLC
jgi:hypothetical protein